MAIGDCASNNKAMGSWKASAFMSSADDKIKPGPDNIHQRSCKYTFEEPTFQGIPDTNSDLKDKMMGYSLTYKSQEDCDGGNKVEYKMNIYCKKDADEGRKFEMVEADKCAIEMNWEGPEGCSFDLNITKYLEPFAKFFGFFEIIIGLVVCFYGSKFFEYTFATLAFTLMNGIVIGAAYNMQIMIDPKTYELNVPIVCAVVVVAILAGAFVAVYSYRAFKDYMAPIIAGWCGGALMTLILTPITALQG